MSRSSILFRWIFLQASLHDSSVEQLLSWRQGTFPQHLKHGQNLCSFGNDAAGFLKTKVEDRNGCKSWKRVAKLNDNTGAYIIMYLTIA